MDLDFSYHAAEAPVRLSQNCRLRLRMVVNHAARLLAQQEGIDHAYTLHTWRMPTTWRPAALQCRASRRVRVGE